MFMNTKVTIRLLMLFIALFTLGKVSLAQNPSYELQLSNDALTSPNTYEFDIYLKRTGTNVLELANFQCGIGIDVTALGGGSITSFTYEGGSQLNSSQIPTAGKVVVGNTRVVNTITYRILNINPMANPGAGSGTIISNSGTCPTPGTKIGHFKVVNSVAFAGGSTLKHVFTAAAASGITNTFISAYVGGTAVGLLPTANPANYVVFNYNTSGTCLQNIVLNGCAVTGSATTTAVTCFGGNDGTAQVTLAGNGSGAPGTYTVDGGPSLPYSTNPFTVTGLTAANHTIVATVTAGGCVSSSITANVGGPSSPLSISGTASDVSCNGGSDGSASITVSAGTSGTYSLNGGAAVSYTTNPFTISGLAAGTYTVSVTSGGCSSNTISVTVNEPAVLSGSATTTATSCAGSSDGTATVTLSSSTSGTYTVDGGASTPYNSNPFTVTGLSAGPHTIAVTTAAGCSTLVGATVGSPAAITGSGTTTPTSCGNPTSGTATITLSSSTSGTYTVDGGAPQSYSTNPFTVTGLTSGPHTIVATTAAGCSSNSISVTVGSTGSFTATYVKTNISACNAGNDGTITITPQGGSGNVTYVWSGGYPGFNPGNTGTLTGLPIGFYNVTVTDNGGCGSVTFNNIHIEFAFYVYVTNSGTSSSACGNTGSIILYGNAGVQPYTYSLNGTTYQASNTFTGLAAGSYTGYVKDAMGCVSTKSITVATIPAVVVNPFTRSASSCGADGSIEMYRSGGTPPYSYSLNGTTYQSSYIFSGLAAGTYTVYVKDAQNCVSTASATVAQGAALTVSTNRAPTSTCVNDGSIQVNVVGGIPPFTYSKDNGVTFQSSNLFSGLAAGTYVVVVKDSKGCTGTVNATINLNPINVTASTVAATSCVALDGKITLFRTGGVGPYTYSLDGNTYQSSPVFTGLAAGTYTGFVKDSKTCVGSLSNIVVGPANCNPGIASTATKGAVPVATATTAAAKVSAYPNPSVDQFNLVLEGFNSNEKVSITVTDVMGRKIYQTETVGKFQIKLGYGFKAGVYNVQVMQGATVKVLKLVKE